MTTTPQIILNNITLHLDHTPVRFDKINLSFGDLKYGIVGDNGVGKTTFLKLLCGELSPNEGTIQYQASISSLPQSHASFPASACIQDVLGISEIIHVLERVNSGNYSEKDLDTLQNQWDIEARIESIFHELKLWPIKLDQLFSSLSGGQKTKVLLAKILLASDDFILLDEPTNNLDKPSRETLYHYINSSKKGMIIVSHDRILLNKMDRIIEITTKGIHVYGGNYNYYREQKEIELQVLQQDYVETKRSLKKTKESIQATREKHEQRKSKGKKLRKARGQAKVILDSMKARSEKSQSKMSTKEERLIDQAQSHLTEIKRKMEFKQDYQIRLDSTRVPQGKMVFEIEKLDFKYSDQSTLLIKDFNLKIIGPERIEIAGPNGCGKSTLIKLIKGELIPLHGTIKIGVDYIAYLDQEVGFLDSDITLVDNFLRLNSSCQSFDAYSALAVFNFRNVDAEKKVSRLSGGERMRAGLAICLMSKQPPQLIILDEPTNHLDLRTLEAIESMLKLYQGAILAIAHDEQFLKNIGINKTITMGQYHHE